MSCTIRAIRAMEAGDLDPILRLATESIEGPRWTRRDYEQILLGGPAVPLARFSAVALCDGTLAGFAMTSLLHQETVAEVEGLVVAREYRRQGIGRALIGACLDWATGAGASDVRLEVRGSNEAAIALYRGLGFSQVGIRRAYYSAPVEDALLLQASVRPRVAG